MGYHLAGFKVVGVDCKPQPHYPFEFRLGDAITTDLAGFDAIHASPPCQAYSRATIARRNAGHGYPDLIGVVRERMLGADVPSIIENVVGAPITAHFDLCGCMFGLRVLRRRWFETSLGYPAILTPCHRHDFFPVGVYGNGTTSYTMKRGRKLFGDDWPGFLADDWREAMGIPWLPKSRLAQAIPPAYTEFIGRWLMAEIGR